MEDIVIQIKLRNKPEETIEKEILEQAAVELEARIKEKFSNLGFNSWLERSSPNLVGILKDLEKGTNVKERRFHSEQTGVDTGILRNSVSVFVRDNEIIFQAIDYAEDFHEGGRKRITISPNVIYNLKKYKKKKNYNLSYFSFAKLMKLAKQGFYEFITPERPLIEKDEIEMILKRIYRQMGFL